MFFQIFFSPRVKPCVIIFYKDDIYELAHELLNLLILEENPWKTEIKLFPLCSISHENQSSYQIFSDLF